MPTNSHESRLVRLKLVNCQQPASAIQNGKKLEINIDLKQAFHQGYIDWYSKAPSPECNPLFDEFRDHLADDPYLIWSDPGIAGDDDARACNSHRLGRCMARAYLVQHCGFTWFAHVSELTRSPKEGWSASRKANGDMPDWLISDGGSNAAIAEAKGISRSIGKRSTEKWRQQVVNIDVKKNGDPVSLPTYIVATRWVTEAQPRTKPEMYVEDPPTEGRQPKEEEFSDLGRWAMQLHTARNLTRLGHRSLAERIRSPRHDKSDHRIPVLTWRCHLPELKDFRFIGRRVSASPFLSPPDFFMLLEAMLIDPHRFRRLRPDLLDALFEAQQEWRQQTYFDGVMVDPVKSALQRPSPERSMGDAMASLPENVSLLSDGSLIAPSEFVEVYNLDYL